MKNTIETKATSMTTTRENYLAAKEVISVSYNFDTCRDVWYSNGKRTSKKNATAILAGYGFTLETFKAEQEAYINEKITECARQAAIDDQADFISDKIAREVKACDDDDVCNLLPALDELNDTDDEPTAISETDGTEAHIINQFKSMQAFFEKLVSVEQLTTSQANSVLVAIFADNANAEQVKRLVDKFKADNDRYNAAIANTLKNILDAEPKRTTNVTSDTDGTEDDNEDAEIAATNEVTINIDDATYRTILLHAEKINNGQNGFVTVLKKELHDLLNVDASELVEQIKTDGDFLNRVRCYLADFPIVVTNDEGTRYHLVKFTADYCELDIIEEKQTASENVISETEPEPNTPDEFDWQEWEKRDQKRRRAALEICDKINANAPDGWEVSSEFCYPAGQPDNPKISLIVNSDTANVTVPCDRYNVETFWQEFFSDQGILPENETLASVAAQIDSVNAAAPDGWEISYDCDNQNYRVEYGGQSVAQLDSLALTKILPPDKFFAQFKPLADGQSDRDIFIRDREIELDELIKMRNDATNKKTRRKLNRLIANVKRELKKARYKVFDDEPQLVDVKPNGNVNAIWF